MAEDTNYKLQTIHFKQNKRYIVVIYNTKQNNIRSIYNISKFGPEEWAYF